MKWLFALGLVMLVGRAMGTCPAGYMTYSVAPGDTLNNIATACGTTASNLAGVNALPNPNYIYPCEPLCIPSGCYLGSGYSYCSSYTTASSCAYTYTVSSGDTLSSIASKCGIASFTTIATMNNIASPYTIYPCQTLCMPNNCGYNTGATNCATGVGGFTSSCTNYYDVAPGDTLSSIASRCGTTYQTIATLSGISNPNLIYPCQRLCLPAGCNLGTGYASSCATGSQCAYTYSVQPGDTLNNIAATCGTTATTIASLSGIANANLIYPCQILCLPSSCSIGTGYTSCSATGYTGNTGNTGTGTASCAYSYYVAPGDTLSAIASRCGTTVTTLASMNTQITNVNLIYPCQRICVPYTCASLGSGYTGCSSYAYTSSTGCAYSYTVSSGQSLSSIATTCGFSSYTTIASLNNIASPYTIYPCQTLCLPSACTNNNVGATSCATGVSVFPSTCTNTYYVAPGDTLYTIATRCGTTYQTLASLSNIANPNLIYPCDKVCLPSNCYLPTTYTGCSSSLSNCAYTYAVAPGDTLSSIASRCGTDYQTIANLSGITNVNLINVCQVVCLPFSCSISPGYRSC